MYGERSKNGSRVSPDTWLREIDEQYLAQYVPAGGSAVKVVSGAPEVLASTAAELKERARRRRCYFALLDPTEPDEQGKRRELHRIDRFFFAVTESVDWKAWAGRQARSFLEAHGVRVSAGADVADLATIATDNGRDPQDLVNEVQRGLATPQLRDRTMDVEFRTAVTTLVRSQLVPDAADPTTEDILLEWFRGRAVPGGAAVLKRIQIYDRINRNTARSMLASYCRWLPKAGHDGLLTVLDFRPYEYQRRTKLQLQQSAIERVREAIAAGAPHEELGRILVESQTQPAVSYGDQAFVEMLSMVRRFIDEIDQFERMLLVILTTPAFYDLASPRNYFRYDALQTRIGQEVHDSRVANPSAALVHLGGLE